MKTIVSLFAIAFFLLACSKDEEVNCTLEFRFVGLTVKGDSLHEYYTIRNATSDTLRFNQCNSFPEERWYLILDDTFSDELRNSQEDFRFVGLINDTIAVDEAYVISADECHINRVSGENEITL